MVSFRLNIEKSVIKETNRSRASFAKHKENLYEEPDGKILFDDYSDSSSTSSSDREYSRFWPGPANPRKANESGKTEDIEVVFEEDNIAVVGPMAAELVDFDGHLYIKMPIYPMSLHAYIWGEKFVVMLRFSVVPARLLRSVSNELRY